MKNLTKILKFLNLKLIKSSRKSNSALKNLCSVGDGNVPPVPPVPSGAATELYTCTSMYSMHVDVCTCTLICT